MKCYTHQDREAVGICKSCGKGLCCECAVDMAKGLACRGQCEDDTARLIALIEQNVQLSPLGRNVMGNVRKNTFVQATFLLVAGLLFLLTGLTDDRILELPGLLGMAFLALGAYTLWRGLRLPQ